MTLNLAQRSGSSISVPIESDLGCFPWSRYVTLGRVGSAESEKVRRINREIIFQELQPITTYDTSTLQTDGRTDG